MFSKMAMEEPALIKRATASADKLKQHPTKLPHQQKTVNLTCNLKTVGGGPQFWVSLFF